VPVSPKGSLGRLRRSHGYPINPQDLAAQFGGVGSTR